MAVKFGYKVPWEQFYWARCSRPYFRSICNFRRICNSRTVERRLQEFGLSVRATYTDISEEHLDSTVNQILPTFPNNGYKRMSGYLRTRGIRIQQRRIRKSMRRVDPQGTLLRALEMNKARTFACSALGSSVAQLPNIMNAKSNIKMGYVRTRCRIELHNVLRRIWQVKCNTK